MHPTDPAQPPEPTPQINTQVSPNQVQTQPEVPPPQPATTKSRSKATALIIAIFFGILTWLYTYRKDRKKFWIVSLIGIPAFLIRTVFDTFTVDVLVDLYYLAVYIWVIIDTARKPSEYFTRYPGYQVGSSEATQSIPQQASDDAINQTIMPTKNKFALKSYYYGCIGILPVVGLPFSIQAITNGRKALQQNKVNPTPGAKAHALTGIVLATVELVFFAIIAFAFIDFMVR